MGATYTGKKKNDRVLKTVPDFLLFSSLLLSYVSLVNYPLNFSIIINNFALHVFSVSSDLVE